MEGEAMSLFDNILGNLDEVAAKLGLPADKVKALVEQVQSRVASGGDHLGAIQQVAQEHGLSLDSLKGVFGAASGGAGDILHNITGALDKDGDGKPLNDLGGMVKGLFGKE
ncbi:MAG: hypothetical protein J0G94_02190 [Sphingomonadales bacterium]|nr:hypothetical protein [Sphingomonadales bacterium]